MDNNDQKIPPKQKVDLVIKRIIDAPVELVWKAWVEPDQVNKWWGPQDYTSGGSKIDLKEGGRYVFHMHAPDYMGGQDMYTSGVYKKIIPMERLEFNQIPSDENGNKIDLPKEGMMADIPEEILASVDFKPIRGDITEITVTQRNWMTGQMFVYAIAGLHQSIDKLIESLRR